MASFAFDGDITRPRTGHITTEVNAPRNIEEGEIEARECGLISPYNQRDPKMDTVYLVPPWRASVFCSITVTSITRLGRGKCRRPGLRGAGIPLGTATTIMASPKKRSIIAASKPSPSSLLESEEDGGRLGTGKRGDWPCRSMPPEKRFKSTSSSSTESSPSRHPHRQMSREEGSSSLLRGVTPTFATTVYSPAASVQGIT
ncbi:hypothetical protein BDZ89DRAFT_1043372 [Hymenopellis radicata]|nr:hypothetical protein BDZ89DRAFT_1043372 [Hymenopellis radicata]